MLELYKIMIKLYENEPEKKKKIIEDREAAKKAKEDEKNKP